MLGQSETYHICCNCNSYILVNGYCDYEKQETLHGTYEWDETEVGQNRSEECIHGAVDDFPDGMATRNCLSPRTWNAYYGEMCITTNTFRIREIGLVSII